MMDGQDNLGQIAALAARVRVLEAQVEAKEIDKKIHWTCDHDHMHQQIRDLQQQLATARAAVVSAIEEEPELPGEMPNDMYKTILSLDRQGLEEWCRILVRATKEGILERYQRALAPPSPA